MDIYPIWRTTYYESDEQEVIFRITSSGDTVFEGKATRKPDEDRLLINLNKPCANALDSILRVDSMSADTLVHQDSYKVFNLDFLNTTTEQWVNVYQFAFFNDWSYENRADTALNDPINGHSAGGQVITATAFVTGDTGQICYQTSYWMIIVAGGCSYFEPTGGTWTIHYETNTDNAYYDFNNGQITGYTSGGTLTLTVPANTGYTRADYYVRFYDQPGGAQIAKAEAHVIGNEQQPGPEPPHSGDTGTSIYESQYLTLEILSGGTIAWSSNTTTYYSLDSGATWNAFDIYGLSGVTVNAGDKVFLKGNATSSRRHVERWPYWNGVRYNAYGNVMSLLYGDNFIGQREIPANNALEFTFGNTDLVSAENLVLPATTLKDGCYGSMFRYCKELTTPPAELPATALTTGCYGMMFENCWKLSSAPKLPATELAPGCYSGMFRLCHALTTPPELPATTVYDGSYTRMFQLCENLTLAPALPADTIGSNCYYEMFEGCTSLTIPPDLPALTAESYCYEKMFSGCTALLYAPVLPATSVGRESYYGMFADCTSITVVPSILPATTLGMACYRLMFWNCSSLTYTPELPSTSLAYLCYGQMFARCTSLVDGPTTLPAISLTGQCYMEMFSGCTSMTTAPELPSMWPEQECYSRMFDGCASLNYVKCLTRSITSSMGAATDWLKGVSPTGTFVKSSAATWPSGDSGIPTGWTVVDAT